MTKNRLKVLSILVFIMVGICCYKNQQSSYNSNNSNNTNVNTVATAFPPCPADSQWINNPQSGPSEVALGVNAQLCQFYQFSWQWFLAMMNTPSGSPTRNYQNQQQYPQWQLTGNSCDETNPNPKPTFFVRARKDDDNKDDFILPERVGQAGGGNIIYDQKGGVVLYEVRFSRNECTLAETNPTAANFPAGTIELKISYRLITPDEAPNYVTVNADINGDGKDDLLGMVGFHFVMSTPDHPEFIWATFEHKQNAPECQLPPAPNAPAWSFTSAQCAAELPNPVNCKFNPNPTPAPSPTPTPAGGMPTPTPFPLTGGTPTQICRVYHDGSRPGDHGYDNNVFDIDTLNTQMTSMLTPLSAGPLAVLQNYQMIGALWVNQPLGTPGTPAPSPNSSDLVNQRGSIQLANSTMETTFQSQPYTGPGTLPPATNCFACHGYNPSVGNVVQSHIFDDIVAAKKK